MTYNSDLYGESRPTSDRSSGSSAKQTISELRATNYDLHDRIAEDYIEIRRLERKLAVYECVEDNIRSIFNTIEGIKNQIDGLK